MLPSPRREQGFNLIAFPCNQFGGQAPESSDGERKIAIDKFEFEFPIMVRCNLTALSLLSNVHAA